MEFFNSIQQVKNNWKPYETWEKTQKDKDFQRAQLAKTVNSSPKELEDAAEYGKTLINSINVMDKYATDKAQDVETATQTLLGLSFEGFALLGIALTLLTGKIPKVAEKLEKAKLKNPVADMAFMLIGSMILPALALPFLVIKFASYEKEAARTARFQAREKKLKDSRNFVVYNKEQIAEAEKIAKNLPDIKEKKKSPLNPIANYKESYHSIKSVLSDHKDYLKWREEYSKAEKNKQEKLSNLNYTSKELDEAKKDQSNLLRTVRKIEINSQNYQSNIKLALNSVLAFDILIGGAITAGITGLVKLLEKIKVLAPESKLAKNTKLAAFISPFILILGTAAYAPKLEKQAAVIGRFRAKKDLLSDPHNFINYTDEQYDSVKNLEAPEKKKTNLWSEVVSSMKFLKTFSKDSKEYNNYKKTEMKKELKLEEALKQVKISDAQTEKSKSLQKNAFKTFEKVDEMSQRYVADVEAATDVTKDTVVNVTSVASQLTMYYLMFKNMASKNMNKLLASVSPILAPVLIKIPIEIASTNIQKQACKIGVMKAAQDLDDPREFINKD